jgi:hypothetical protein
MVVDPSKSPGEQQLQAFGCDASADHQNVWSINRDFSWGRALSASFAN